MPLKTPAIAGIAICGQTVCGDISVGGFPPISSSDIYAIAVIESFSGWFQYICPVITLDMTINQVFSDDSATVGLIHGGEVEPGMRITIYLGQGAKEKSFTGIVQSEIMHSFVSSGRIYSEFVCPSHMNVLSESYLDDVHFSGALHDVIDRFIELTGTNIENKSLNNTIIDDLQFESHSLTALDILKRIIGNRCYLYLSGDKLIIEDKTDQITFFINKNSNIVDFNRDSTQANQYRKCTVRGSNNIEVTVEAENIRSNKELFIKDESIITTWEAEYRARMELETANETTEALVIKLSGLVIPRFGMVFVNLPGIDVVTELKSIRYQVDENGLYTILYLGRAYESLPDIFKKIKR